MWRTERVRSKQEKAVIRTSHNTYSVPFILPIWALTRGKCGFLSRTGHTKEKGQSNNVSFIASHG
jgi:hypothetical protein